MLTSKISDEINFYEKSSKLNGTQGVSAITFIWFNGEKSGRVSRQSIEVLNKIWPPQCVHRQSLFRSKIEHKTMANQHLKLDLSN